MGPSSLNEFREAQANLRRETLVQLQAAKANLYDLCNRYDACREQFLRLLDASPRHVVYRYHGTRDAILTQIERLTTIRDFLQRSRWTERLSWKLGLLNHEAVARQVLKGRPLPMSSESRHLSRKELQTQALEVLEAQLADLERKLASHEQARQELLAAAGSILDCMKEMFQREIVPTDRRAIKFLEGVLRYVFWDEPPCAVGKGNWKAVKLIESALAARPLRQVLQRAFNDAARSLVPGALQAEKRMKHDLFQSAAKQLVARLRSWKDGPQFSALEQAILALHFTFSSSRLGLGSIDSHKMELCRRQLEEATEAEVSHAVRSLIEKDVLSKGELEVFRYTPAVWNALEELV